MKRDHKVQSFLKRFISIDRISALKVANIYRKNSVNMETTPVEIRDKKSNVESWRDYKPKTGQKDPNPDPRIQEYRAKKKEIHRILFLDIYNIYSSKTYLY